MNYLDILRVQLRIDEGVRQFPYEDTRNNITIGIGRNLTAKGLNDEEQNLCFENDLSEACAACRRLLPEFEQMDDVRKAVMVNMAFNLGYKSLSKFPRLLAAVRGERWEDAASYMLQSLWHEQVGSRAVRLANNMKTGAYARI